MRATWFAGSAFALALLVTGLDACKGSSDKQAPPVNGSGSGSATAAAPSDSAEASDDDGGTASATCVPRDDDVFVTFDKQLLVCAVEARRCFSLDPRTGATAPATYHDEEEERVRAQATVADRDGKPAVCFRDKCRVLGPNAKKELASVDPVNREDVAGTVDLVALVVPFEGDWHIWDVAKDKRIELPAPSAEQGLGIVRPTGNELYVVWTPPDERVYSSAGKELASLYNEGSQLVALDDTHWAALTGDRIVQVFGEAQQRIDLQESLGYTDWTENLGITAMDDGNLAVALARPTDAVVALIDPRRGTVYKRWPLAICK